jgi:hypothetical protein
VAAPDAKTTGDGQQASPEDQVKALYEQAETRTAKALEQLVARPSFGELVALSTENLAAATRMANEFFDLVLRNLRLASRADIARLHRQLHRTEDKLERVLQELEELRDEVARSRDDRSSQSAR